MDNENIDAPVEEVIPAGEVVEEVIATVEEPTPVVEEIVPVVVPEPEPEPIVIPEPVVVPTPKPVKATAHAAVTGEVDNVFLSKCVYENKFERKSLTIHHLQRRLEELGYRDAASDRDGWMGSLTMLSINKFQKDKGLEVTDKSIDEVTFTSIFAGDHNVNINL